MSIRDWFRLPRKALGRDDVLAEIAGRTNSASGKNVNTTTALQVSTVLGCARVIAEGIAQPPLKLLRNTGKKREPATDHPLYYLLAAQPNPWQSSFEYRETVGLHAVLCGNSFSFKNRSSRGELLELLPPFESGSVTVKRADDWTVSYEVRGKNGETKVFPAEQIWHIKGPSWNGYLGLEAWRLAREAIGLSMATEEAHAKLHKNAARVGGLISVEGTLTDEKYQQMRKWLAKNFEGSDSERAYGTMIMDRAAKFTASQQTGVDAQHLETRRYQVEEVCRFMRVMPIMVGYSDKAATYASAEQMFLAHVVHTLSPWWERIEQSANMHLLTEKERAAGYFVKFIEEGLLRGSAKETKDVLIGYVNGGLMTPNEGRAKLDLNPDPDPKSDELRVPANVVGDPEPEPEPKPDPKKEEDEKAERELRAAMLTRLNTPLPAPVVQNNVDARSNTTIAEGAVKVSAPIDARSSTTIAEGAVRLNAPVDARTTIAEGAVRVEAPARKAVFDKAGNPIGTVPCHPDDVKG